MPPCRKRLQRACRPSYRYACSASPELHTSIPLYRYIYVAPQTFRLPYLISLRLGRVSRHPYLHTSTPLRLQRASRAPELQSSIPLRLYTCSEFPELHNFTSLHRSLPLPTPRVIRVP